MKPEMRLLDLMRYASQGHSVCVIGKDLPSTMVVCSNYQKGPIFFRNYDTSGLLAIRVDTVWFMEDPVPEEVAQRGRHLTCMSDGPRVIWGDEDEA